MPKLTNHISSITLDSKEENMCCYTATSSREKLEKYDELFKISKSDRTGWDVPILGGHLEFASSWNNIQAGLPGSAQSQEYQHQEFNNLSPVFLIYLSTAVYAYSWYNMYKKF